MGVGIYAAFCVIFMSVFIWLIVRGKKVKQKYVLSWSDEFDGAQGTAPDQSKWNYEIGGNGWGNHELQTYTKRTNNAFLDGCGNLVIKAIKEEFTGEDGTKCQYTSARMVTRGKFAQRYGRFEARIKVPFGQGIWPAFWMLGDDISQVGWPDCGEIDIMENIGVKPATAYGSLHGPGHSGGSALTGSHTLPAGQKLADDFHIFAVEWEPAVVRFYFDGKLYYLRTPDDVPGKKWVFDHPFFLLLNVAVGGSWPGYPDATSTFPQMMTVDYVRVYKDTRSL